jgi:F-type H+-transporting ATPase subunit a
MRLKHVTFFLLLAGLIGWAAWAAPSLMPAPAQVAAAAGHQESEEHADGGHGDHHGHHEMPLYAVEVFKIGPFPVTNSMIVTWIVALALIVSIRMATRQIQEVPSGAQNFWEWLVETLYDFLEGIIGSDLVKKTFWFFATIFIFILFTNWFGLLPGVGTIGHGVRTDHGFMVTAPLFRGANADLNMTFAMAMVFFVMWTVWALQANGVRGFFGHIFGAKGDTSGALRLMMVVIFFLVGIIEVVSILFRPVSLSFRLFGNIYAGENMLESMATLVPGLLWQVAIPLPFYFLEVLVGLVQALVFILLTAVFTLLICTHDEEHGSGEAHG